MRASLTIIRYKNWAIPLAFISMALFHFSFFFNKMISFYKLMGTGKNGTFDKIPDLNQWAIFTVFDENNIHEIPNTSLMNFYGKFINHWINLFAVESFTFILEPITGHGLWDDKAIFGKLNQENSIEGQVATLTRATIRISKLKYFWEHVAPIASKMKEAKGYQFSVGIGEVPWVKQATFSVWESLDDMKNFAYSMKEHRDVVKKTRTQNWYSEDMFVRFRILYYFGTINGKDPINKKA
jgi:hypothetical protein